MQKETIKMILSKIKPGQEMIFSFDDSSYLDMIKDFDVKIIKEESVNDESFIVTVLKSKPGEVSRYRKIMDILDTYKTGASIIHDHDAKYVRTVVSKYNKAHDKKFKVSVIDGGVIVFLELEDRDYITRAEWNMLKSKYDVVLSDLESKIIEIDDVVDNEFTPDEEDYI